MTSFLKNQRIINRKHREALLHPIQSTQLSLSLTMLSLELYVDPQPKTRVL